MRTSFEAAKALLGILEVVGWLIVCAGVIGAFLVVAELGVVLALVSGGAISVVGFLIVVMVQLGLAQIATAENTAEMLVEMRRAAEFAKAGNGQVAARSAPIAQQPKMLQPDDSISAAPVQGDAVHKHDSAKTVGRVKSYKGYLIARNAEGRIVVGATEFENVLDAEAYINTMVSKRS